MEGEMTDDRWLAAPCGLYCGVCGSNLTSNECHGCGCDCGDCAGAAHAEVCRIARCAADKGYATCAECDEMPCTYLTEFAFDPVWRTHLPVLEHLRRIRRIGADAWVEEQRTYWADERRLTRWLALYERCTEASLRKRG